MRLLALEMEGLVSLSESTMMPEETKQLDKRMRQFLSQEEKAPPEKTASHRRSSVDLKALRSKLDRVRANNHAEPEEQSGEEAKAKPDPPPEVQTRVVATGPGLPLETVRVVTQQGSRLWETRPLVLPPNVREAQESFQKLSKRFLSLNR